MLKKYSKGIIIPIALVACVIGVGVCDGGTEAGNYPVTKTAIVQTVIIINEGENSYIAEEKEAKIKFNTYGNENPIYWEPCI